MPKQIVVLVVEVDAKDQVGAGGFVQSALEVGLEGAFDVDGPAADFGVKRVGDVRVMLEEKYVGNA